MKSDPLADFDTLAAFIPRMARLKEGLSGAARTIADLPDRLGSDIQGYLSAVDAQEERIERFKTGYAVVRNSARYLPLAATNVAGQAEDAGDDAMSGSIGTLLQDMNLYLATPSDAGRERIAEQVEALREASVTRPPPLANAIANLLAHTEVLLERKGPTEALFAEATSGDIAARSDRLASGLAFERDRNEARSTNLERGMLAVVGALALFWCGLGLHQRRRGAADAPAAEAEILAAIDADDASDARTERRPALALADDSPERAPAETPAPGLSAEGAMHHAYVAERVGEHLAGGARRITVRMDALRHTHARVRAALQDSDFLMELPDGADLDEEIEAGAAIAENVRREANAIANVSRRLAAFARLPNGDAERDMVDVNACIGDVVAATGAERAVRVHQRLGDIPEMFGSKTEIRLLLAQVVENALRAVEGLEERAGMIKIDTAVRDDAIIVTVIDNGAGIAPARRAQMFRPFYTSRDGAMGLGLALTTDLVKRYEGSIKVNSLPGRGTVARITLPAGAPGL